VDECKTLPGTPPAAAATGSPLCCATRHQGPTLINFCTQPEPFLSLKPTNAPHVSHRKWSGQAEKWTSVSPCPPRSEKSAAAAARAAPPNSVAACHGHQGGIEGKLMGYQRGRKAD